MELLRYVAGAGGSGSLLLVAAYRRDELDGAVRDQLARLVTSAVPIPLTGLSAAEVGELIETLAGPAVAERWAGAIHERSNGHPFFARELGYVLASGGEVAGVPSAVHEVIARRVARVSTGCARLLEAASVAGRQLLPDVLADVLGEQPAHVLDLIEEAEHAGIVAAGAFAHDLYRESVNAALAASQRLDLHHRIATALERRHRRGGPVFPGELSLHFAAAVPVAGPGPALTWAHQAAQDELSRFAFAEAAGQLARARAAIAQAGAPVADGDLVDALVAEADAWQRSGDAPNARRLLDDALDRAHDDPTRLGAVALGLDRLGARFAMPRIELVAVLDRARIALDGAGTALEAQVTAALARQLQHSVPRDRPRARPLAERAVAVARKLDDEPGTLASCLLAQHDTLWTPGTATERIAITHEIADLAGRAGDQERRAEALLLTASAQLEAGSPAFRAALTQYREVTAQLRQPRHDYLLRTREAALALLDGDLDTGERLVHEAAAAGAAVGDRDAGNVRMSQLLEIVRAGGDRDRLRATAAEAIRWWVGVPAHAHAVAAGFLARAGDLEAARREVDTVLAIEDWRTDRSYLWSIFAGELTAAAVALDDRAVCAQLLDDLLPIADTCAVNGALVCFMGAHAHRVGLLYAALGEPTRARDWLERALETHRRLGATLWVAETLAALGEDADDGPVLRRTGNLWRADYRGRSAHLPDLKGLHDLATLLSRPGQDVPAIDLMGSPDGSGSAADPVLDRSALNAYRRRLAELDQDIAESRHDNDLGRAERSTEEREQLLVELRRATKPGGASRLLGATAAERARKAVAGRIRDAIRRIDAVLPELGAHLDRTVRTGTTCGYHPDDTPR
jgi:tetratricopeptide (TPR) repeat protein